jgi:hypothetical protein
MPKLSQQQAQELFEPEVTQPLPRVSTLVDRRKLPRRSDDRRKAQLQFEEERRVAERRRHRRRRQDGQP